mmetsp:Transcript_34547/g.70666  ORF Transcript_34547/g.70666 Transcript_34547/m.70666 type:complete len:233 (-) Transcript_34547:612-1310(-)
MINVEVVFHFGSLGTHRQEELRNVVTVERTACRRKSACQIGVSKASNSIVSNDPFIFHSCPNITTSLSSQIHSHASSLHLCNHFFGNHQGSLPSRNRSGSNDNINFFTLLREHLCSSSMPLLTHLLSVSTSTTSIFFVIHLKELTTHCLNLLLGHGTDIKGAYNGTHVFSSLNSSKSGNTRSNNQHFGRGDLSSSRHLSSKEATKFIRCLNDSPIPSNVRLRTQCIICLTTT